MDNILCIFSSMDGNRVVIPLEAPEGSKPGDRVFIEGYSHEQHGGTSFCVIIFISGIPCKVCLKCFFSRECM